MNILVIGAASRPGKKIISSALRRGHIVTAFTEKPDQVKLFDDHLRVIKGSCCSAKDLNAALDNQNIVIKVIARDNRSVLPVSKSKVYKSIDTILTMMYGHQIDRFIVVDTTTNIINKLDRIRHIKAIKSSSLDWTLVRPAKIIYKPKTCKYRVGENTPIGIFSKITCGDVASFVVSNLDNNSTIGKVITIRH
jgi:putative NADH-flavin reductase